ncbi:hypothetical protein [Chryseobacterium wangxinyae]|uniref:hypothetical protein n=1 Tax=unclassified Chryseobacterium TaxID=2593645 RepID=UPI0022719083|nr:MULTISPECIES: hypothetical protein [unclassified Chryseobacterium]MCY0970867.1 hypothetical protein [Chryseobacterium sp. CY353]MCY0977202.1 hypothetical protein [Chryseobacterium sp. CY350]WBZ95777.1 hypothetical protein PGH12_01205 [Chryseobacterium sp. CY350]
MKTILTLFFCSSLFSAQNIFKNYIPPEYSFNIKNTDSLMKGSYINVNINGMNKLLLFDTGAPKSVIFNKSNELENIFGNGSTKSAVGEKVNMKIVRSDEFSSSIVNTKYKTFFSIPDQYENYTCSEKTIDGILGMDFYFDSKKPVFLDYKSNTIKLLDNFTKKDYSDYFEADVKFKGLLVKNIFIEIFVNGRKEKFLFDTGATDGSLYMKVPDEKIQADYTFETLVFSASGIESSEMNIIKENTVTIGKFTDIKTDIIYLKELPNNLMGLSFIKNFNWIIDKKNGKIYFKPISGKKIHSQIISRNSLYVAAYQKKLKIIFINKSENQKHYKIGDEIASINNQIITPQNLCEMQNLLNKTEDWEKLNIQIKN